MKYDVFISYSRKDTEVANHICKALDKAGITYFIDRQGIGGAYEFPEVLANAIIDSRIFLFLASKHSYVSKFTQAEITFAFNKKERGHILPYVIDGSTMPISLEFVFSAIQCRYIEKDPTNVLIDDLLNLLGKQRQTSSQIQTIYYADGKMQYEGELQNGKYHGQGTYYFTNGDKYVGQFKDGVFNGQGILYYAEGGRYEGQFKDDKRHGQGTFYYSNGAKYIGQFKNGKWHGQGTCYYAEGGRYEGQFEDDKCHGQGIFYFPNGDRYEGQFEDNQFHGKGIFYHASGDKQEVSYNKGELIQQSSTKKWKFW